LVGSEINQLKRLRGVLSINNYDIRIALDVYEAISLTGKTSLDLIILDMDIAD
jgi:DNA-binding response OmpR family regulator